MFPHPDASPRIGLDCVVPLSPGRLIAFGWLALPPGVPAELAATDADGAECPIEYVGLFPRAQAEPHEAPARGFALVLSVRDRAGPAFLSVDAGPSGGANTAFGAALPAHELPRVIAEQDWTLAFGLLRDAATLRTLRDLPVQGGRRHGAFAEFLARMPLLRGKAEDLAGFATAEVASSPAGEAFLTLQGAGASVATVEALGLDTAGVPMAPLALHPLPFANGVAAYAIFAEEPAGLVLRIGDHGRWLRCEPASLPAGQFLCRLGEVLGSAALMQALAEREDAFGPALAAVPPPTAGATRTAVLVGLADPMAVRLLHVTAPILERRFERLIALGTGAEDAAELFRRRGRIAAEAAADAAPALRQAGAVDVLYLPRFAEALADGALDAPCGVPMSADAVARLVRLHATSGNSGDVAESLACLLTATRPRPAVDRGTPHDRLVAEHLERLWQRAEAPAHA